MMTEVKNERKAVEGGMEQMKEKIFSLEKGPYQAQLKSKLRQEKYQSSRHLILEQIQQRITVSLKPSTQPLQ